MKKQFLLLLLLTLLPLAGWATKPVVSGLSAVSGLKYTGEAQALLTGSIVYPDAYDYDNYSIQFVVKDQQGEPTNDEAQAATSEIPTGTDVQLYWIYYRLPADNAVYDEDGDWQKLAVRINKAETSYSTEIAAAQNLVYTSEALPLIATAPVPTFGTVLYKLGDGDYSPEIPTATDAGTYTVYYKVEASDNWKAIAEASVDVTITKKTAEVTAPTVAEGLVYSGSAQQLITAVATTTGDGTLMYSLDGENWYPEIDIDELKGTAAGDYTVSYKMEEGTNFAAVDAATVNVSIAPLSIVDGEGNLAANFALSPGDVTDANQSVYKGAAIRPSVALRWKGKSMSHSAQGTNDYTRTYSDNVNASEEAKITFTGTNNFTGKYVKNFTINKAELTVNAKDFTKTFGEDDPTSDELAEGNYFEFEGWVGADATAEPKPEVTGAPVFTITDYEAGAGTKENVITISGVGTLEAANYTFVAGAAADLIIENAEIPVESFNAPAAIAGLKANGNPELVTAGAWKNPEVTYGTFQYSTDGGENWSEEIPTATAAGEYTVNYMIKAEAGNGYNDYVAAEAINVTVAEYKPVYVIPNAAQKFYGQSDPQLTYTVETVGGETLDNSVLEGTVTLARVGGNQTGEYKIYVKKYEAVVGEEYSVANVLNNPYDESEDNKTAAFTILADPSANLTMKFTDAAAAKASKVYDGNTDITALGFDKDDLEIVDGAVGTDEWSSLKAYATVTFALTAEDGNVQETQVVATVTGLNNYSSVTVEPMTFNITPAPITLYAKDQALDWSDADDTNDEANTTISDETVAIAVGELKNSDALTDVVASIEIESTKVGNNRIILVAADNANYVITVNKDAEGNDHYGNLDITGAAGITLDGSASIAQAISDYDGQEVNVKIDFSSRNGRNLGGDRSWKQFDWMTLTLPFEISVADLSKKLGYAIVNVIDDSRTVVSGESSEFYGKLTMTGGNGNDDVLVANKPFLVKTADDIDGVIDFGLQTIVAPASAEDLTVDAGQGATFVGAYAPYTVTSADDAKKWFMIGGGYGKWAYIKTTSAAEWTLQSTEAYLQLPIETQSIIFNFEEADGSTTAIKSVNADDLAGKKIAEGWYTINGVKLQNAPAEKGVYIKDGKKVVLK